VIEPASGQLLAQPGVPLEATLLRTAPYWSTSSAASIRAVVGSAIEIEAIIVITPQGDSSDSTVRV
jgi:hypothetical protein